MAFSLNKKKTAETIWKVSHVVGNEFVTFVLDKPLLSEVYVSKGKTIISEAIAKVNAETIRYLESIIKKVGITSYVITSALDAPVSADDVKKAGKTDYFIEHNSGWFEKIVLDARKKGMTADVIVPFGAALYQMTKSATDFNVYDLIYPAFEHYVYIGEQVGKYNAFLFPQFGIDEIFYPERPYKIDLGGWKMNYMVVCLKNIFEHKYQLPADMSDVQLKEIGADYDKDPERAVLEITEFLKNHLKSDVCAFDLETSGFSQWNDKIRCITLAFDSTTGYYIEWKPFKEHPELVKQLSEMMKSATHRVTVNGKFDIKFLWVNGLDLDIDVTEDAMTLSHCICSERRKGLKSQTWFWTKYGGYDHALDEYRDSLVKQGIKDPSYYDIPKAILFPYATMDAVMTVRVWLEGIRHAQEFDRNYPTEKPIEHTGGHAYSCYEWYQFVMKLYPIICHMEYEGLHIDKHVIDLHKKIFEKRIQDAREKLAEIFGVSPNYEFGSTTQLGKLIQKAGWKCHGLAKSGLYQTSNECFKEWKRDGVKGVDELIAFRKANVCLKTYLGNTEKVVNQKTGVVTEEVSGWPQYTIHHPDGSDRIHCDFGVCATETYRMISKAPNLQNVPTHSVEGSITKMAFTTPPAPMYHITDETGKTWDLTELDAIHTQRGYVLGLAVTEEDTIIPNEKTVLEYEDWCDSDDIEVLGKEKLYA